MRTNFKNLCFKKNAPFIVGDFIVLYREKKEISINQLDITRWTKIPGARKHFFRYFKKSLSAEATASKRILQVEIHIKILISDWFFFHIPTFHLIIEQLFSGLRRFRVKCSIPSYGNCVFPQESEFLELKRVLSPYFHSGSGWLLACDLEKF